MKGEELEGKKNREYIHHTNNENSSYSDHLLI
jgi:hypothetical protein